MEQLGEDFFTRNITVWSSNIDDTYGDVIWGSPVLLKCWFKETNELFKNSNGEEKIAKYKIIMGQDSNQYLGDHYYVAVDQDQTSVSDPTTIKNTFEIGSFGRIAADSIGSKDVVIMMV